MSQDSKKITQRVVARSRSVWAMSNVFPEDTGIAGVKIWISTNEVEDKRLRRGPRVKVQDLSTGKVLASVTISEPPTIAAGALPAKLKRQVLAFVTLNHAALLAHWNQETSSKQALNALKPVS